jgi:hypothetical protein
MLDKGFPVALDDTVTRIACILILLGGATIRYGGWTTLGWVIVTYGVLTLWLAHLFAVAPAYIEPTDTADLADW